MSRGQETKEKLFNAALDLIWKSSFGSVSVDDICAQAGVLKGSFYHFFPSKVALAVAAVKFSWEQYRPQLDLIYSPDKKPLQRFLDHCDFGLTRQKEMLKICGFVPGCPFTSLGSEQGTQNEDLRNVIDSHLKQMTTYFKRTIEDAIGEGEIPKTDVEKKTAELFSFYLGSFTYARITNDLEPIENMKTTLMTLLGANAFAST